jgi:hypothetical protein
MRKESRLITIFPAKVPDGLNPYEQGESGHYPADRPAPIGAVKAKPAQALSLRRIVKMHPSWLSVQ